MSSSDKLPLSAEQSVRRLKDPFIHVPTPGDHYSGATGSAVITVLYELGRIHVRRGGELQVVVGADTRHDYPVGTCIPVVFPPPLGRWDKLLDVGLGRAGLPRTRVSHLYAPAARAIDPSCRGTVVVHNAPAVLSRFRKQAPRTTLCLHVHNQLFGTYRGREAEQTLASADHVVCVSEFIANDVRAKAPARADRVIALPNGVDTDRFRPAPPGSTDDVPTILFVGRMVPQKGPDLLLRAAAKLRSPRRQFRIRIVGSINFDPHAELSGYEQELRQLAAPLGDSVEFVPFQDREAVLGEYQAADIFCAPSNWDEPCSLTVSEAMACGVPTIAARRGGIPEVGGNAALYFDPPDIDALAERLAYLIDQPEARTHWGHLGRNQAESISWERQYERLCVLLGGGSGPRGS